MERVPPKTPVKLAKVVARERYTGFGTLGIPESMGYTDKVRFVEFIDKSDRYTMIFFAGIVIFEQFPYLWVCFVRCLSPPIYVRCLTPPCVR